MIHITPPPALDDTGAVYEFRQCVQQPRYYYYFIASLYTLLLGTARDTHALMVRHMLPATLLFCRTDVYKAAYMTCWHAAKLTRHIASFPPMNSLYRFQQQARWRMPAKDMPTSAISPHTHFACLRASPARHYHRAAPVGRQLTITYHARTQNDTSTRFHDRGAVGGHQLSFRQRV